MLVDLRPAGLNGAEASIALDEAERNGATLEITRLIDSFYAEVQAMGGSRWDTSSLIVPLRKLRQD